MVCNQTKGSNTNKIKMPIMKQIRGAYIPTSKCSPDKIQNSINEKKS